MTELMVQRPTGADVAAFLGQEDDPVIVALAGQHVGPVVAFARSYTRGEGFDSARHTMAEDLHAVVLAAAARMVNNPEQVEQERLADYSVTPTVGWTLVELAVLNRYRKRAR